MNCEIKNFKVISSVGEGAFGAVSLVEHVVTNKKYVIKSMSYVDTDERELVDSEIKFLKLVSGLQHFPIFYNSFHNNVQMHIVLNYVEGMDLFEHLAIVKKFNENAAKKIIAQIIHVIQAVHDKGYIYKDLKLENVMIGPYQNITLVDFGFVEKQGSDPTFRGTSGYMPPEVLNGEKYDKSVDWWALGILCAELLSGYSPFENDSDEEDEVATRIIEEPPCIQNGIKDNAKSFILNLLDKNPKTRLGSKNGAEEILAHPFFTETD